METIDSVEGSPFTIRICEEDSQFYVAVLFELHRTKEQAEYQRERIAVLLNEAGWDVKKMGNSAN